MRVSWGQLRSQPLQPYIGSERLHRRLGEQHLETSQPPRLEQQLASAETSVHIVWVDGERASIGDERPSRLPQLREGDTHIGEQ